MARAETNGAYAGSAIHLPFSRCTGAETTRMIIDTRGEEEEPVGLNVVGNTKGLIVCVIRKERGVPRKTGHKDTNIGVNRSKWEVETFTGKLNWCAFVMFLTIP